MTAFSYYLSYIRKKQFREPELLNELLVRARMMKFTASKNHPAGWIIHYLVGVVFVIIYQLIAAVTALTPDILFYSLGGLISGFIGVAIWHVTLSLHPNSPALDLKEFYFQLVIAHIIFGLSAYAGLWLI